MTAPDDRAVFQRDGDLWIPGPEAKGPFPGQHGGAFGAVIALVMDEWARDNDAGRAMQFCLYMQRPTPMAPLRVELEVLQSGRRMSLLRAALHAEDKCTATATAVFVRPQDIDSLSVGADDPRDPLDSEPFTVPEFVSGTWFRDTVEMRRARDGTFWMRPRLPVVEPFTPLARVVAHADWLSGVSRPDSFEAPQVGGFPNADLTVHLAREPRGEWLGLRGDPNWRGDGIGLTATELRDTEGPVGRSAQSLVLTPLPD